MQEYVTARILIENVSRLFIKLARWETGHLVVVSQFLRSHGSTKQHRIDDASFCSPCPMLERVYLYCSKSNDVLDLYLNIDQLSPYQ